MIMYSYYLHCSLGKKLKPKGGVQMEKLKDDGKLLVLSSDLLKKKKPPGKSRI